MSSESNSSKIIFVTGSSGFIGYHIVTQLLNAGYTVRAAARGIRADRLRKVLGDKYSNADVLNIPDIYSDDLSRYLKGVYAIVHVAAPTPGEGTAESNLKIATDGVRHIMNETLKAGVKRVVATSSVVTFPDGGPFGAQDWNPVKMSEVKNHYEVYAAQKTAADKCMADFVKAHPQIDLSLIGPNLVYGPFAPGYEELAPEPDYAVLSTSAYIHRLLRKDKNDLPRNSGHIDVRDVAKAHLLALKSSTDIGLKRFALSSPEPSRFKEAVKFIVEARPELRDRLVDVGNVPELPPRYVPDTVTKTIEKQIGFKTDEYISWKDTVLDTADGVIALENYWKAKGYNVTVPITPVM
ncbi:NAD(P)-binding protein [Hymenopellis radicata]|nr:NAD(P)-binding protein [Hymenopellis radicata]